MALRFYGLDYALRATLQLYEVDTISDYIYLYELSEKENADVWRNELKEKEDLLYKTQQILHDEIEQVLLTYQGNGFTYFFKLLNDVVKDEDINEANFKRIESAVETHNKAMLATKTEEELHPLFGKPPIINVYYLQRYFIFAGAAIIYLRNIIQSYLSLYNEGKLSPNNFPQFQQPALIPSNPPHLPAPKEKIKKLTTVLNAEQLVYLFQCFYNAELISKHEFKEICQVISASFKPTSKRGDEDLSVSNLQKLWSAIDINNIAYWQDKFLDLHKIAKKDNPHNIKYSSTKR